VVNVCSLSQKKSQSEEKARHEEKHSRVSKSNAIAIRVENLEIKFNQYLDYIVISRFDNSQHSTSP
jgi:hypothetical protein